MVTAAPKRPDGVRRDPIAAPAQDPPGSDAQAYGDLRTHHELRRRAGPAADIAGDRGADCAAVGLQTHAASPPNSPPRTGTGEPTNIASTPTPTTPRPPCPTTEINAGAPS
jgi:hypothetical protein